MEMIDRNDIRINIEEQSITVFKSIIPLFYLLIYYFLLICINDYSQNALFTCQVLQLKTTKRAEEHLHKLVHEQEVLINVYFKSIILRLLIASINKLYYYNRQNSMGCFSSNPSKDQIKQPPIDLFAIDPLKIDQHIEPRYFILLTHYDQYHANYEARLKQTFPNLKVFKNREELFGYRQDDKNNILIVCCKNNIELQEVKNIANKHTFNKIAVAYNFDMAQLQQKTSKLQKQIGFRFKRLLRDDVNAIKQFFESATQEESLYFCHKNQGLINRTLALFHYFFRSQYRHNKRLFLSWLKLKNEGRALSEMIQLSQQRQQVKSLLLQSLFSESPPLKEALNLLGRSRNPGVLLNISWLVSLIFQHIRKQYQKTLKNLKGTSEYVVWIQLSQGQVQTLKKAQGQNFMFSTFVIGWSDKNYVPEQAKKANNWFKIYINIPKDVGNYQKEVDLGFHVYQNRAIFNIFNMFRVDNFLPLDKSISVTYSSIGFEYNLRNSEFRYSKDAKKGNLRMMKLYDYYCLNKMHLKDQFDLVLMMQMYEKYRQMASLRATLTKQKLSQLGLTKSTTETVQSQLYQGKLNQYLGDCEFQTKNYNRAIQYYDDMFPPERGLMKKLNLYHLQGNGTEYRKTMEELKRTEQQRPSKNYGRFTKIAFYNFIAIMSNRSGDYSQASKKIHETIADLGKGIEEFNFHNESYTSFPLYSMLQRTQALIARQKGDITSAELIEKQCEANEMIFDGVHKIWLQRQ